MSQKKIPLPPRAEDPDANPSLDSDFGVDGLRSVVAHLGPDREVGVWAAQYGNGHLDGDIAILLDQHQSEEGYSADQAREISKVLIEAAELAEQWATWTPEGSR